MVLQRIVTELRVPTVALVAEVACTDGRTLVGHIFVPASALQQSGHMKTEDWINEPLPFFPFLSEGAQVPVMLNKHTVITVTVESNEGTEGEGLVGLERHVVIECGQKRIKGSLRIDMPQNLQRVQDYLNRPQLFVTLTDGLRHHLVQKHHITSVVEIQEE